MGSANSIGFSQRSFLRQRELMQTPRVLSMEPVFVHAKGAACSHKRLFMFTNRVSVLRHLASLLVMIGYGAELFQAPSASCQKLPPLTQLHLALPFACSNMSACKRPAAAQTLASNKAAKCENTSEEKPKRQNSLAHFLTTLDSASKGVRDPEKAKAVSDLLSLYKSMESDAEARKTMVKQFFELGGIKGKGLSVLQEYKMEKKNNSLKQPWSGYATPHKIASFFSLTKADFTTTDEMREWVEAKLEESKEARPKKHEGQPPKLHKTNFFLNEYFYVSDEGQVDAEQAEMTESIQRANTNLTSILDDGLVQVDSTVASFQKAVKDTQGALLKLNKQFQHTDIHQVWLKKNDANKLTDFQGALSLAQGKKLITMEFLEEVKRNKKEVVGEEQMVDDTQTLEGYKKEILELAHALETAMTKGSQASSSTAALPAPDLKQEPQSRA